MCEGGPAVFRRVFLWLFFSMIFACSSIEDWGRDVYPYVYTPEENLPEHAHVRWETEDWGLDDPEVWPYLKKIQSHWDGAPQESRAHFRAMRDQIPPLGRGVVMSFVGDVLWIADNYTAFAEPVRMMVRDADLALANLETAASGEHRAGKTGIPLRFNAPPEMLDGLPFDVLQLNNNHALDRGDEGLASTKHEVTKRGIVTTGVDEQAILEVSGKRIAIMSFTWGVNDRGTRSHHELFIVPFGHLHHPIDLSPIAQSLLEAEGSGADLRVVTLHWGYEFEYYPDPHFLKLAREIIALGADLIVAQGPHVVQPAELCYVNAEDRKPGVGTCSIRTKDGRRRTAAVLYSLGNFTNEAAARIEVEVGINVKVSLDEDVTGLAWTPTVLRQDPVRVEAAERFLDDTRVKNELDRLNAHLGAGWREPRASSSSTL